MTPTTAAPPPPEPPVLSLRTLRGLAAYACGHSGACCSAGWPVPIEAEPLALLRRAEYEGRLPRTETPAFTGDMLGRTTEHDCVFHDAGADVGCRLEPAVGYAALPITCRQFPRILLVDARGWQQSLSAWCVTAASIIAADSDDFLSFTRIAWDDRVHVEALDARETWPPELRPGLLLGTAGYAMFEERVMESLAAGADAGCRIDVTLRRLLRWTCDFRRWCPADGSWAEAMDTAWRRRYAVGETHSAEPERHIFTPDDLIDRIPEEVRPTAWPAGLTQMRLDGPVLARQEAEAVLYRYLGARLVGSWLAYQGQGVLSVLASLVSSYGLAVGALRRQGSGPITLGRMTSAIRASDWLQLHLLEREDWAAWCSQWESRPDAMTVLDGYVDGTGREFHQLPWASS